MGVAVMRFEFATAGRILFGAGALREVGSIAAGMGRRALVVAGASLERAAGLLDSLDTARVEAVPFVVEDEPTVEVALAATTLARERGCNLSIGFGGGSAIDTAKAAAALLTNPGDPYLYLEVIGQGQPLKQPSAPCIAIPTTAGTGSEVTRNAVLASPEHRVKVSLRSPTMLPDVALVDPELTYTLPPAVTAATGLDALTQVIEPFVSPAANPLTDAVCREGMRRAGGALRRAYLQPDDRAAREDMALASLCGGLALANAKLGAVHGFAGPFGGMFHAPHGAVCAALLPHVMMANIGALQARDPLNPSLERYAEVARILTSDESASPADGAVWVGDLVSALDIPGLASYGLSDAEMDDLITKSAQSSSMKGNPISLTTEEMRQILMRAL